MSGVKREEVMCARIFGEYSSRATVSVSRCRWVTSTVGESGAVRWKMCSQHTVASEAVFWLGGT